MIQHTPNIINIDFSLIPYTKKPQINCLIVMNSQINDELLTFFVGITETIILCDGGSNHFYQTPHRDSEKIIAIVGDLDSIRPEIRKYYQQKHIIIQDLAHDQDTNDLEKCIKYALQQKHKIIACLGALGGRFDQEMCNINILERYGQSCSDVDFIILGKSSILLPIKSEIQYRIKIGENFHKDQCGLICFGSSKVETTGFRWNLGSKYGIQQLRWKDFVSSSNHIIQDTVSIHSSAPIFFSLEFIPVLHQVEK